MLPSIFKRFLLCAFLFLQLAAVSETEAKSHLSEKITNRISPYLLPQEHPLTPALETLFSRSRAIINIDTLSEAGFVNPKVRKWTHVVVTKHPELPGYIIKTYLDSQRHFKKIKEFDHWIMRIEGARAIQALIDERGWNGYFKVPKKWIYTLPTKPSVPKGLIRKNCILIEEDMKILNNDDNSAAWKSDLVTKEKLQMLYEIIETLGLNDCAKISNVPISEDGRMAFIDTESTQVWPVHYKRLTKCLAEPLQDYWEELTGN